MILSKDIIKEWGMDSLSSEDQEELVSRVGKMLYQAVLVRSLDILSTNEEKELDSLLDLDITSPDDVVIFLQSKITNFDKIVKEERKKIKEDIFVKNA